MTLRETFHFCNHPVNFYLEYLNRSTRCIISKLSTNVVIFLLSFITQLYFSSYLYKDLKFSSFHTLIFINSRFHHLSQKKNLHQIMSFVEFCSSIFVFLSQDLLSLEQFRRNTRSFSGNLLIRLFLLLCLFTINQNFEFNKANFI